MTSSDRLELGTIKEKGQKVVNLISIYRKKQQLETDCLNRRKEIKDKVS